MPEPLEFRAPLSAETRDQLIALSADIELHTDSLLAESGRYRALFDRLEMPLFSKLFHVQEFTCSVQFELACLFSDYLRHELGPRAHVYLRFVVLAIYESTKTYRSLLGRDVQSSLASFPSQDDNLARIRSIHRELVRLSELSDRQFGDLRNGLAAHRDAEAAHFIKRAREVGGEELGELVIPFLSCLNSLFELLRDMNRSVAEAFALSANAMFLRIGDTGSIVINDADGPLSAERRRIEFAWRSDDVDVATVSDAGDIFGIGDGFTRVHFSSVRSDNVSGTIFVFVGDEATLREMAEGWNNLFGLNPRVSSREHR